MQGCEEETFTDVVNNEDDEEERFTDADKAEEGQSAKPEKAKEVASWVHYQNLEGKTCFSVCLLV